MITFCAMVSPAWPLSNR